MHLFFSAVGAPVLLLLAVSSSAGSLRGAPAELEDYVVPSGPHFDGQKPCFINGRHKEPIYCGSAAPFCCSTPILSNGLNLGTCMTEDSHIACFSQYDEGKRYRSGDFTPCKGRTRELCAICAASKKSPTYAGHLLCKWGHSVNPRHGSCEFNPRIPASVDEMMKMNSTACFSGPAPFGETSEALE